MDVQCLEHSMKHISVHHPCEDLLTDIFLFYSLFFPKIHLCPNGMHMHVYLAAGPEGLSFSACWLILFKSVFPTGIHSVIFFT